jgi:hypothetical protein
VGECGIITKAQNELCEYAIGWLESTFPQLERNWARESDFIVHRESQRMDGVYSGVPLYKVHVRPGEILQHSNMVETPLTLTSHQVPFLWMGSDSWSSYPAEEIIDQIITHPKTYTQTTQWEALLSAVERRPGVRIMPVMGTTLLQ